MIIGIKLIKFKDNIKYSLSSSYNNNLNKFYNNMKSNKYKRK